MKQVLMTELQKMGFEVTEYVNGILVSLKNRKVSAIEVDQAIFEKMEVRVGMQVVMQGVFIGTVSW